VGFRVHDLLTLEIIKDIEGSPSQNLTNIHKIARARAMDVQDKPEIETQLKQKSQNRERKQKNERDTR